MQVALNQRKVDLSHLD